MVADQRVLDSFVVQEWFADFVSDFPQLELLLIRQDCTNFLLV